MYADMHMHSTASDGTCTPEQLARMAKEAGVTLLALADHNTMDGTDRMRDACGKLGIVCIDAVELDALYLGEDLHVLAYAPDRRVSVFGEVMRHERAALDGMSTLLIRRMQADGLPVDTAEYEHWPDEKPEGGWKALYYLRSKGIIGSVFEGFPLYGRYDVTYQKADFLPVDEVIDAIHAAGGYAVLAHPGIITKESGRVPLPDLCKQIRSLFALGLDGAECVYPKHTPEEKETFLALCREEGKLITSGADCHGTFSGHPVGWLRVPADELNIGPILARQQQI